MRLLLWLVNPFCCSGFFGGLPSFPRTRANKNMKYEEYPRLGTTQPVKRRFPPSRPLRELVNEVNGTLPSSLQNSGVSYEAVDWFLMDRLYDPRRAGSKLADMIVWRQRFEAKTGNVDTSRERRSQKGYFHEHCDVLGRPVIGELRGRVPPPHPPTHWRACT